MKRSNASRIENCGSYGRVSIRRRIRHRSLGKQWNGMQTVEMQRRFSSNDETNLSQAQRLILHRQHKLPVEKYLDDILADDRIPVHSERLPINWFGRDRSLAQHCHLIIEDT